MVQVMFEENIADWTFLREQTDLGLLVRDDTKRYLRQPDVEGEGREDQLYQWDPDRGLRLADRGNMKLEGLEIALEGTFDVELADGSTVQVRPAGDLLREHLNANFTPEKQQEITGVHPDVVRTLARKIASKKTNIMLGYNAGKFYHGDLIERAMCLVLAASGNWGKKGTGIRSWAIAGGGLGMNKPGPGAANTEIVLAARDAAIDEMKADDPTMTDEIAVRELGLRRRIDRTGMLQEDGDRGRRQRAGSTPPVFWWYWQAGYDKRWNTPGWGDDSLPRTFDDYFNEALEKGWWDGLDHPRPELPPQVLIECGGNMLRRTRGGKTALLDTLWPKLKTIITIDFRMSQTALYADYVLPAAQHYEKLGFSMPSVHVMNLTFSDESAEPAGESRNEWDIFQGIIERMSEIAAERGLTEYDDGLGRTIKYADLVDTYSMKGFFDDPDRRSDEGIRDSALSGSLPSRTTLETFREQGHIRFIDLTRGSSQASPVSPTETFVPYRNHVEQGDPFPTYARRAQFYIDHEWFLEAGEQLPTHKPNPNMGGDYPLGMTSGHNRWSIHTMNQANHVILGTHRGEPHVMVNSDDANARGVEDDDLIRVFNDVSEFWARSKVAPNVKPGQLISYNGWAGFQYPGWGGANEIEPGMVKWIALAGGYGHLRFTPGNWQPVPVERWTRCDFEKASEGAP
jgi:anaerobic selenocysteine-containing dehydrogenase